MGASGPTIIASPAFTAEESENYRAAGWWSEQTISDAVHRNAVTSPDRPAYIDYLNAALSWHQFDCAATLLAEQLTGAGVESGDRIAVWHGDSTAIHVLFVAIERCGAVVVGIGARAGTREVAQILRVSRPRLLISDPPRADSAAVAAGATECLPAPLVLSDEGGALSLSSESLSSGAVPAQRGRAIAQSRLGPDDVFLINSTSGTTGLPKCVVHTQNLSASGPPTPPRSIWALPRYCWTGSPRQQRAKR